MRTRPSWKPWNRAPRVCSLRASVEKPSAQLLGLIFQSLAVGASTPGRPGVHALRISPHSSLSTWRPVGAVVIAIASSVQAHHHSTAAPAAHVLPASKQYGATP